ncbi:MAG: ATP synthase F1 subunit delta, partial [Bacteroidota bacterium]
MNISHIASPYSSALFELAIEKNILEECLKDMKTVTDICKSNRDFRLMLKSPLINTARKKQIFTRVFGESITPLTLSFLLIIIRKRRESFIPDIAHVFVEQYKDYKGILTTVMQTPVTATDEIRKEILGLMKSQLKHDGTVDLIETVNPELIGGFILQWK